MATISDYVQSTSLYSGSIYYVTDNSIKLTPNQNLQAQFDISNVNNITLNRNGNCHISSNGIDSSYIIISGVTTALPSELGCYNDVTPYSWTGLLYDYGSANGSTSITIEGQINNLVTVPNGAYSFTDYVTYRNDYAGIPESSYPPTMFQCSFTTDNGTTTYGISSGSIAVNNNIVTFNGFAKPCMLSSITQNWQYTSNTAIPVSGQLTCQ